MSDTRKQSKLSQADEPHIQQAMKLLQQSKGVAGFLIRRKLEALTGLSAIAAVDILIEAEMRLRRQGANPEADT